MQTYQRPNKPKLTLIIADTKIVKNFANRSKMKSTLCSQISPNTKQASIIGMEDLRLCLDHGFSEGKGNENGNGNEKIRRLN